MPDRYHPKSVQSRANVRDYMYSYCRVTGCPSPARAGTSKGLDTRFCRKHADHYSRHGSPYKRSYTARTLGPHRKDVRRWLKENREDRWVLNAVQRVQGLYDRSGAHVEAFRLAGLNSRERARKAWARLRTAGVDPIKVLETWLVVGRVIAADPQPDDSAEFRRVQAAKIVHRLASGSHKTWVREVPRMVGVVNVPIKHVTELHKYPHSRGRVLRIIGQEMEDACGLVVIPADLGSLGG
jgi:hypothetical protein